MRFSEELENYKADLPFVKMKILRKYKHRLMSQRSFLFDPIVCTGGHKSKLQGNFHQKHFTFKTALPAIKLVVQIEEQHQIL